MNPWRVFLTFGGSFAVSRLCRGPQGRGGVPRPWDEPRSGGRCREAGSSAPAREASSFAPSGGRRRRPRPGTGRTRSVEHAPGACRRGGKAGNRLFEGRDLLGPSPRRGGLVRREPGRLRCGRSISIQFGRLALWGGRHGTHLVEKNCEESQTGRGTGVDRVGGPSSLRICQARPLRGQTAAAPPRAFHLGRPRASRGPAAIRDGNEKTGRRNPGHFARGGGPGRAAASCSSSESAVRFSATNEDGVLNAIRAIKPRLGAQPGGGKWALAGVFTEVLRENTRDE